MSRKPLVSAIIPVYNEEKYLAKCLKSLLNQTYKPLEIIVVDDSSTDDSYKIVRNLKSQIPNLKLFKQRHQGPGFARNLGASKAKGEILVFPDADMWFDKRYIEKLVNPILKGKAIATWTKEEYVANQENIWSRCWSIGHNISYDRRVLKATPDRIMKHRAILKDKFDKVGGYTFSCGGEDSTVMEKLKTKALAAKGAICYHFNPDSLKEVFMDAQFYGRTRLFGKTFKGLLWVSLPNSLWVGFLKAWKHKMPAFLIYQIVHDLGVNYGVLMKILTESDAK